VRALELGATSFDRSLHHTMIHSVFL